MSLDSWRRASDPVVYAIAVILLAGVCLSIWLDDWRWIATSGAFVVVMGCVIALTEERRGTP